ncbi:MAG TPA: WecB/TagA/CpsF family glycosyltransferase [Candidatus Stackebrandtia excrementipullorum]|nr:WecB/TagA/CpsF family glycosyltransferase [Candidatus Stackebrandtia excrementipullorum]
MTVGGVAFDPVTLEQVTTRVRADLAGGRGGRIVTPNVDIVRQTMHDARVADVVSTADLVVADGAPLVWASKLAGCALPERVAGSDLIWHLSRAAAEDDRSIFLLGGAPGGDRSTAAVAADRLIEAFPGLFVAGACSPPMGFDRDRETMRTLVEDMVAVAPDIVFVGLGFPKQEDVIGQLAARMPSTWFLGCGAAVDFVAGHRRRAPIWMQRSGLEWLHRLASEPRRLARRYLVHDAPTAFGLLARSSWTGLRRPTD